MPERKFNFAIDVIPKPWAKAGKTVIFYLGLDNSGLKSVHGRRYILSHRQKYLLVKPKTMIGWEVIITHWDLVYESTYPILPTHGHLPCCPSQT